MESGKNREKNFSGKEQFLFWKRSISGYKRLLVSAALLMMLTALCGMVSPLFQKRLIDGLNRRMSGEVLIFSILTAATLLCGRVSTGSQYWFSSLFQLRCTANLKGRFFRHLLQLPLGAVESVGSGYIGQKLHYDIDVVVAFFSTELLSFFVNLLRFIGAFFLLFSQSPLIGCAALPVLGIFVFLTWNFRGEQYRLSREISDASASFRRTAQNSLDRLQLFKTQAQEGFAGERIHQELDLLTQLRLRRIRKERLFWFFLMLLPGILLGSLFFIGAWKILEGQWTLGELWASMALLSMLFAPATACCQTLLRKKIADASLERLLELEKMLPEDGLDVGIPLCEPRGEVEFDRLFFAYPGGEELFHGFSAHLAPGEHLLLTGQSGGGKSTLGALLMRLYEPAQGTIRIDGRSLAEYELHSLRRAIGYIGQATEQFLGTVRENLGREHAKFSDEELFDALKRVGLDARVREIPEGLDGSLNEDAGNFSAGEKVRLALARELLRKTRILLLDEVTANLDQESCEKVYDLLRSEWKNCTVLLISHRPFPPDVISRICAL